MRASTEVALLISSPLLPSPVSSTLVLTSARSGRAERRRRPCVAGRRPAAGQRDGGGQPAAGQGGGGGRTSQGGCGRLGWESVLVAFNLPM